MRIFFAHAVILCATGAARAAPADRCQLKPGDVIDAATAVLKGNEKSGDDFTAAVPISPPDFLVFNTDPTATRDSYAEGFVRPPVGFIQMLESPKAGVRFDDHSLIYVCLDLKSAPAADGRLIIQFLDARGLDRSRHEDVRVSLSTSNIEFIPKDAKGMSILELPLVGGLIPEKFLSGSSKKLAKLAEKAKKNVIQAGITQVTMSPDDVSFAVKAQLLSFFSLPKFKGSAPVKSTWMVPEEPESVPAPADH